MTLDITLYAATGTAKLAELPAYERRVRELVSPGADVTLTGSGPVRLYLGLAHTLHGRAGVLTYESPVSSPVAVFNDNLH